jgi:hypothetical protein
MPDIDETFAPRQLAVGPLTDPEHAAIMADGSLINDPYTDRDNVLCWRKCLRVASDWHRCPACEIGSAAGQLQVGLAWSARVV